MSYWENDYPKMPSFWTSLAIVAKGALTGWLTYTDWSDVRNDLRHIIRSLSNLMCWFAAWAALVVIFLTAPFAIAVYMIFVRRQQRRVMITNRKRYLRDRLRVAVRGYSWG